MHIFNSFFLLVKTELESSLIIIVTSNNSIVELSNWIVTSKNAIPTSKAGYNLS